MRNFFKKLRNYFFTGVAVVLPLFLTLILVRFLLIKLNDLILEPGARFFNLFFEEVHLLILFKICIFLVVVFVISLIGLATKHIIGKKLVVFLEKIIKRIPLVGRIYSAIKEIFSAFVGENKTIFKQVVLVEYPRRGIYSLGFVTSPTKGELQREDQDMVNVFIPTTPNPTSGILLVVPRNEATFLKMSVEEGLKLVISGGVISPDKKFE